MRTPVVRGKRLRATRVGNCGLPIAGEASSIVTKGFVTVSLTRVMKDAEDIEATNADGQIAVTDRTAPELKWYEFSAEFAAVDPELLSFFTDDAVVLDYAQRPVGFRSSKQVKVNEGAAVEVWTGVGADDCEDTPEDDDAFNEGANANRYGYFLLPWVKEATMGDFEIGAEVMTFTVSGITGVGTKWGRGPHDVIPIDDANTPGRLMTPMGKDQHLHFQSTTIEPPRVSTGARPLTIPAPYFGEDAVDSVGESDAGAGDGTGGDEPAEGESGN